MKPICRNCMNFYGDHHVPRVLADGAGYCKVEPKQIVPIPYSILSDSTERFSVRAAATLRSEWPDVSENESCPRFKWAANPEMFVGKVPDDEMKAADERRLLG